MLSITQRMLIQKDIQAFSKSLGLSIVSGFVFIAILLLPGNSFVLLGSILIITVMLGFYPYLITACVTREHREKNTVFVMTLPITMREYLGSKILSCFTIYFICWSVVFTALIVAIMLTGHLPGFMVSYFIIIFGLFIPAFLFTLLVAIQTESEGWTIAAFVLSNIIATLLVNIWPNLPATQHAFGQGNLHDVGIVWLPFITHVLIWEAGLSAALISVLAILVSRKQQFINF